MTATAGLSERVDVGAAARLILAAVVRIEARIATRDLLVEHAKATR